MIDDLTKYEGMRNRGASALEVYRAAAEDGLDQIESIQLLRSVFGFSLEEAKRIGFEADTGETYEAQEGKLVDEFTKVLDDELGPD